MKIQDINYKDYGENKKGVIVLLHGWGQNIQMMDMLGTPFKDDYRVIVVDLPGFGASKEPKEAMSVVEYAEWLHLFLKELNVKKPIIVGHSFGGRIGICYAGSYETEKLVLLSSPFRPEKKKTPLKVKIYKFVKKVKILPTIEDYLKHKWGSSDYNSASDVMRNTLVKTVNFDLTEYAKKITCPTVLIYGDKDETVNINEGKALENLIVDSGLIVFENCTHYAYLEKVKSTITILKSFFN